MSCVWGYTHDKKRETERNPDLCLQGMRIPVSKQRKGLSRRLMEKLPGRETDSVGVGSRLWGKRLDNQATAAGGGDGVGAAATFWRRFRSYRCHLLGAQLGSDACPGRGIRQAIIPGIHCTREGTGLCGCRPQHRGTQLCHKGNRDRRDEKPVRRVRELQDTDVPVPHDPDSETIPYPAPQADCGQRAE